MDPHGSDDHRDEPSGKEASSTSDVPATVRRPAPLTGRERRIVALAAVLPIAIAAVVLLPFALRLGSGLGELFGAAVVYGGLVGAAAAFVTVDRFHARQCPRCRSRTASREDEVVCSTCGYDLVERPRYTCTEGHTVHLDEGLCDCGRRLHRLPTARGVGPQVRFMIKVGIWLLAFLIGVGIALQLLDRTV